MKNKSKTKHQNKSKNPFCNQCRIPLKKKGTVKLGEKRFRCTKCGYEQ